MDGANKGGAQSTKETASSAVGGGGPDAAFNFGAAFGLPTDMAAATPMSPEDAHQMLSNMAVAFERGREIWEKSMMAQASDRQAINADPFNAAEAFGEWWRSLAADPTAVTEKTLKYWTDQAEVWRRATLRAAGEQAEPVAETPKGDKRFKDEDWSKNVVFDALRQSYLLTAAFLTDTAKNDGALTARDRRKVEFFTRQFVEAISPTNYFATNPEVLRATFEEKGENLVRGLSNVAADLERGRGTLLIRQTDLEKFKVGENMAVTPGKVIFQNDVMELIQYSPTTPNVEASPILICPPWINKYYILDLNEKKSLVKWLVAQGHTVFMMSWVNPDERHQDVEFVDYIADGLFEGCARALDETDTEKVHVVSYCIAGTMTGAALAYLAEQPQHPLHGRIASATFFTAQTEFSDAGELQLFVDEQQLATLDGIMQAGVLGAEKMASAFNMLRSSDLIWNFVINNYMLGREPFPFDLLYWNSDSTRMPARVHRYYLEKFYKDDALALGELQLGEVNLRLKAIDIPTYHVATKEDHIAPAASVYRGVQLMGGERRMVLAGSGHIAGVVNPPAGGKYQFWTRDDDTFPETIEAWREGATETPGSWWTDWDGWLKSLNGDTPPVKSREPGRRHNAIGPAPGSYVQVRYDAAPQPSDEV